MIKINTILGWTLVIGIIVTQLIITKVTFDMGRMAPYYAFLTAIIFFPLTITAIASVLSRDRDLNKIKFGIKIGLFFQVVLPMVLPLFFDKEFIYLSLIGVILAFIMWFFRKKIEVQLLILNGIGAAIWAFISSIALINS